MVQTGKSKWESMLYKTGFNAKDDPTESQCDAVLMFVMKRSTPRIPVLSAIEKSSIDKVKSLWIKSLPANST